MKERFRRFMAGRYGNDSLNSFLFTLTLICIVLEIFTHSKLLYYIAVLTIVIGYFRMFSKNHAKRYEEEQKFLALKSRIFGGFGRNSSSGRSAEDRENFRIFRCPQCKQKIRIPRGKGKVKIRCPKCGHSFVKKS